MQDREALEKRDSMVISDDDKATLTDPLTFSTEALRGSAKKMYEAGVDTGMFMKDTGQQTLNMISGAMTKRNGMSSTGFVTFKVRSFVLGSFY